MRIHVQVLYESNCFGPERASLRVIFKYDPGLVARIRRFGYWSTRNNEWMIPRRAAQDFASELMRWEREGLAWVHADGPARLLMCAVAFAADA